MLKWVYQYATRNYTDNIAVTNIMGQFHTPLGCIKWHLYIVHQLYTAAIYGNKFCQFCNAHNEPLLYSTINVSSSNTTV